MGGQEKKGVSQSESQVPDWPTDFTIATTELVFLSFLLLSDGELQTRALPSVQTRTVTQAVGPQLWQLLL